VQRPWTSELMFFVSVKAFLRCHGYRIRRELDLIAALIEACGCITANSAYSWFKHAGYVRWKQVLVHKLGYSNYFVQLECMGIQKSFSNTKAKSINTYNIPTQATTHNPAFTSFMNCWWAQRKAFHPSLVNFTSFQSTSSSSTTSLFPGVYSSMANLDWSDSEIS